MELLPANVIARIQELPTSRYTTPMVYLTANVRLSVL
jgi:hypothetical protein